MQDFNHQPLDPRICNSTSHSSPPCADDDWSMETFEARSCVSWNDATQSSNVLPCCWLWPVLRLAVVLYTAQRRATLEPLSMDRAQLPEILWW